MVVSFHSLVEVRVPQRKKLRQFLPQIFAKEGRVLSSLNVIFCSDEYLLDINRAYLNHDFYTDIISFDLSENSAVIGELYISIERVKENAENFKVNFAEELLRVLFHGVLHLCGYKDKAPKHAFEMRKLENLYLSNYYSTG